MGTFTASTARIEAQLVAEGERTRDLAALGAERDTALKRAAVLDVRREQSREALADEQRAADAERHAGLELRAHVERLGAELHAAGVDTANIPPPPAVLTRDEP